MLPKQNQWQYQVNKMKHYLADNRSKQAKLKFTLLDTKYGANQQKILGKG